VTSALDPVQLTKELVRMNTINPPGHEESCARHLGALLETAGFHTRYHSYGDARVSLVATVGGNASKPPICLTGHIDTVPLGAAAWRTDPFAGETAADKLYGRGTSDMKSGVAAITVAAIHCAKHLPSSSAGVTLVITAGEETGCEGAFHLYRDRVLDRAGAIIVAEPTSNYPFVGHKGALWLKAKTRGVTAHGSMPEKGVNAVYKAARAVSTLEAFQFQNPAHELMGQATLNVGTIHGGLNINSVPDAAEVTIDIRSVPTVNHAKLIQSLAEQLGPDVELETMMDLESVYTDAANVWMQSVFEVMAPLLGEHPKPRVATYFTDAAALSLAYQNPPTVILGPGEPHMAHQTDEYCSLERIGISVQAFEQLITQWNSV
jgi:succinyl-diaminopimelate desuccinylase